MGYYSSGERNNVPNRCVMGARSGREQQGTSKRGNSLLVLVGGFVSMHDVPRKAWKAMAGGKSFATAASFSFLERRRSSLDLEESLSSIGILWITGK